MLTTTNVRKSDHTQELDFILVALAASPPRWWQMLLKWRLRRLERSIPVYIPSGGA